MRLLGFEIERLSTRYGRMYVQRVDSVIGQSLRLYGEWAEHEIATVSRLLLDGPAIVDVGANIGTHTLAFAARFPRSPILAIEPQPLPYGLLTASALLNGYDNVHSFNLGACSDARVVRLSLDYSSIGWNMGAVSIPQSAAEAGHPVLMVALDELLHGRDVQFLKVDVEGMESEVLEGTIQTLRRCRPLVYLEVLDGHRAAMSAEQLAGLDYRLYWVETSAFNPANFNGVPENIWAKGELGLLATPRERAPLSFPEVTDPMKLPGSEGAR